MGLSFHYARLAWFLNAVLCFIRSVVNFSLSPCLNKFSIRGNKHLKNVILSMQTSLQKRDKIVTEHINRPRCRAQANLVSFVIEPVRYANAFRKPDKSIE